MATRLSRQIRTGVVSGVAVTAILAVACGSPESAEEAPAAAPEVMQASFPAPTFHHIHINSVDPERSIEWYSDYWPQGKTRAGQDGFPVCHGCLGDAHRDPSHPELRFCLVDRGAFHDQHDRWRRTVSRSSRGRHWNRSFYSWGRSLFYGRYPVHYCSRRNIYHRNPNRQFDHPLRFGRHNIRGLRGARKRSTFSQAWHCRRGN